MSRVQDCRLHINEAVNDIRLILSCQAETKIRKTGSIYFNLFEKSTPFMAGLEEIPCFCLYSFFPILFRINTEWVLLWYDNFTKLGFSICFIQIYTHHSHLFGTTCFSLYKPGTFNHLYDWG